jgi:DNA-binding PadR family transcriptional regulator
MDHEAYQDWHGHWFRGWHGMQAKRGDMSPILLRVLNDKPMHGYEIIRELEKKSHGFWRPSPGSVYPTLQLLEEQELVTSHDEAGKKIYTVTDAGREEAKKAEEKGPWEWHKGRPEMEHMMELRVLIAGSIGAMKQIMRHGNEEQRKRAMMVLGEAKTKLEAIAEEK